MSRSPKFFPHVLKRSDLPSLTFGIPYPWIHGRSRMVEIPCLWPDGDVPPPVWESDRQGGSFFEAFFHEAGEDVRDVGDVFRRGVASEAETKAALDVFAGKAHRGQDRARLG